MTLSECYTRHTQDRPQTQGRRKKKYRQSATHVATATFGHRHLALTQRRSFSLRLGREGVCSRQQASAGIKKQLVSPDRKHGRTITTRLQNIKILKLTATTTSKIAARTTVEATCISSRGASLVPVHGKRFHPHKSGTASLT